MPCISIILPLYNGEKYIRHMVAGIRAQAYQDWELLVIDDGSSDGGRAAVLREAGKDGRIHVYDKQNGGISSARNYGISKASGRYIAFADQDDAVGRNWLLALYKGMAGNADLAVGGKQLEVLDAAGRAVRRKTCRYADAVLETEAERYAFIFQQENDASSQHIWNCLYKKELIDKYGICFDEGLAMGMEDVLFNICYAYRCRSIHKIPQVVYAYKQRIGTSTSTKQNPNVVKEYAHRMHMISNLFGFQAGSRAYGMYGDYALREMCSLYFRSSGMDSMQLLDGLRDAYVNAVPEKYPFRKKYVNAYFFARQLFKAGFYRVADATLRKGKYAWIARLKTCINNHAWRRRLKRGRNNIGR